MDAHRKLSSCGYTAMSCKYDEFVIRVFLGGYCSLDLLQSYFDSVEAKEQPEISKLHSVSAVPFFVFFKVLIVKYSVLSLEQLDKKRLKLGYYWCALK
ncbi:hypothetical protein HAX54_034672 [Datura stramonium]|uniref:Uncharacterized protein n=1 Tax=Datura stramonium TaxID=4076 RepID=A0ABS8VFJ4_DATST|nr:hypothetical protein [Datura stramonium]